MIRVLPDEYLKILRRLGGCWVAVVVLFAVWWLYQVATNPTTVGDPTLTVFGHTFLFGEFTKYFLKACLLSLAVMVSVLFVVLRVICPKCRTPLAYNCFDNFHLCRECGDCFQGSSFQKLRPTAVPQDCPETPSANSLTGVAGGGGRRSSSWSDFLTIRLMPRDYRELVLRCSRYTLRLIMLQTAVVLALLFFMPLDVLMTPIKVFGHPSNMHDMLSALVMFSSMLWFLPQAILCSRFIRLYCPTCLRQLDYQSNGQHDCCRYCGNRWDRHSLVLHTPPSVPSPSAE